MNEPLFLGDEDLIALGRALQAIYPGQVSICGTEDAPARRSNDRALYSWCRDRGAVLVTADFNMLRDAAILQALLAHEGIRVLWIRQIRGQSAAREYGRIIGRWEHVRTTLITEPDVSGLVLAANGQLRRYRTIADTVIEVLPRRRSFRQSKP